MRRRFLYFLAPGLWLMEGQMAGNATPAGGVWDRVRPRARAGGSLEVVVGYIRDE